VKDVLECGLKSDKMYNKISATLLKELERLRMITAGFLSFLSASHHFPRIAKELDIKLYRTDHGDGIVTMQSRENEVIINYEYVPPDHPDEELTTPWHESCEIIYDHSTTLLFLRASYTGPPHTLFDVKFRGESPIIRIPNIMYLFTQFAKKNGCYKKLTIRKINHKMFEGETLEQIWFTVPNLKGAVDLAREVNASLLHRRAEKVDGVTSLLW